MDDHMLPDFPETTLVEFPVLRYSKAYVGKHTFFGLDFGVNKGGVYPESGAFASTLWGNGRREAPPTYFQEGRGARGRPYKSHLSRLWVREGTVLKLKLTSMFNLVFEDGLL